MSSLEVIAERINTGADSPDTSRALVVFNQSGQPVSGIAVFHAAMSWPRGLPLPPVVVTDAGACVPSAVRDMTEGPDAKGRPDRRRLAFALGFAVAGVPANGWRTYIATYTDSPGPLLTDFTETPSLIVVETTRHGGDLPPVGSFPTEEAAEDGPGKPGTMGVTSKEAIPMRVPRLSEEEISRHLAKLPGWTRESEAISKTYQLKDFSHALGFVNQVAETAEAVNHHPDILIRYSKVTLTLTTHDSGGLTLNDVDLAAASDDFADGIGQ